MPRPCRELPGRARQCGTQTTDRDPKYRTRSGRFSSRPPPHVNAPRCRAGSIQLGHLPILPMNPGVFQLGHPREGTVQSRPKPRGSSTSRVSRSTSQTPSRKLGGPGVGQGLGQSVAPRLVFSLQGAELVDGIGPPLWAVPAVPWGGRLEGPDGLAGVAAFPEAALALGVRHAHGGHCTRYCNGSRKGDYGGAIRADFEAKGPGL